MQKRLSTWTGLFVCNFKKKCMCSCSGGLCMLDTTELGVNVCLAHIILGEFITIPSLC